MSGMPVLCTPEMQNRLSRRQKERQHFFVLAFVRAMHAPCQHDLVTPANSAGKARFVVRAYRGPSGFQPDGRGFPQRKEIDDFQPSISQLPRAPFAAFDGWIVCKLGRLGRVEHHI